MHFVLYVLIMKKYSESLCNNNIFIAVEVYLANPSYENAEIVKNLSHSLTNQAYEKAKVKFPHKPKIGGDEYAPILLELIQGQVVDAVPYSTRLVLNTQAQTTVDPQYIFKISKEQQLRLHKLIGDLLKGGKNARHPHGLIDAYDGYMERRSTSQYSYCEGVEARVYDFNSRLYEKAVNLQERGYDKAADVLFTAVTDINTICNQKMKLKKGDTELSQIAAILTAAQTSRELQEHRGIRKFIDNFFIALTGVGLLILACTAEKRGSFWYRPLTDSEGLIEDYKSNLTAGK